MKVLSLEDIQNAMKQFSAWFERISDQGKMKGAQLAPEGKILSGRKGVTDGPFAESKEGIAGYWFIQVASLEEAVVHWNPVTLVTPIVRYPALNFISNNI